MNLRHFGRLSGLLLSFGVTVVSVLAQSGGAALPTLMPREREIEMALSAGPESIRKDAAVYVLQRGGYVKAREGTNGFACIVLREGHHGTAPNCYDAEGSQTTLLARLRAAELLERGKSEEEVNRIIAEEYRAGKLLAPRKPGIAYMLSSENNLLNPRTGKTFWYSPHVMIYAPYLKNADIGALPQDRGSLTRPWVLNEGKPDAYIIVVPQQDDKK